MKKSLAGILAAVLLVTAGATSAFAEEWERGRGFVDADSDGICDFAGTERPHEGADGDGICDNCGRDACCGGGRNERGRGFVDADGDGVCDSAAGCMGAWDGTGRGRGFHGGCDR